MSWVQGRLAARLVDSGTGTVRLDDLVTLALRRNPKRAHLLVSGVLGKHVPVAPAVVLDHGRQLGRAVADALDGERVGYVLGYAETATALGHCVAAALAAPSLHSTRRGREVTGDADGSVAAFEEEHSHATGHHLLPEDPSFFARDGVVVLVDDEVSTGRTALNTVESLQRLHRRDRYALACLVDVRDDRARADFDAGAAALGVRLDVVSLASGHVQLPAGFELAAASLAARVHEPEPDRAATAVPPIHAWPADVRDGGRHGFGVTDDAAAREAAAVVAAAVAPRLIGARVLVLGFEELMYAPLLIADALQGELGSAHEVRFSTTTRSPVVVIDEPGYPIRTRLTFAAHDSGDSTPRFAYNVAPCAGAAGFDDIVVVVDDAGHTEGLRDGLLAQVSAVCGRVHLLVLPSYRPARVPAALA